MKLKEIVAQEAIIPDLESKERDEAIVELVDALCACGAADEAHRDALVKEILERERRGSTGFGKGVAVPHVKHGSISEMRAAIGLSPKGIDFDSLDKQPVYSIVLLLSPANSPEEHLQPMEAIFSNLSKDTFRRVLRQARNVEDVVTLLDEADSQQLAG